MMNDEGGAPNPPSPNPPAAVPPAAAPDAAAVRAARLAAVNTAMGIGTGGHVGGGAKAVDSSLDYAVALVERYLGADAATTPEPILQEAITRIVGHGLQSQTAAVTQDTIGPRSTSSPDDRRGLLKRSGAESLLSPWKTRRAGVVE